MNSKNLNDNFNLEDFFELSADLICIAGFDGYFRKINSAVSKTLGYTHEELFAKPIDTFIHAEDRKMTSDSRENIKKNNPLLNFENRYLTKSGEVVWLTWTSMPIKDKNIIFAIAKNITHIKKIEEYRRISDLLSIAEKRKKTYHNTQLLEVDHAYSPADQYWLSEFEGLVRKYTGKIDTNITMLSHEMAISERQLYRRIKTIMGITPNKYIRIIRLQLAKEAIETGKYRTLSEISYAVGFKTPAYFSKLFKEIYSVDVAELL